MPERPLAPGGYVLGIDLGTTYSAAAVRRGAIVEPCVLGTIAPQIPSVVVHRDDGEVLTGEAAERRAASEPTRTAREFKRRLGDPIPMIIGGTPFGAEALMAELLRAIVRQVTEREGEQPTTIVLTHPANYSEYKRGLLLESARLAGLDLERVRFVTEPEAAAIAYAHQQRIEPGEIIAVYDFGGGTFDAAVVRSTDAGFELIGTPEGMERLGGIDFDQAVLAHVDAVLDGLVSSADASSPQVLSGQVRLRDDCRRAKEALSDDTDATIPISLPGVQTDVRLTREELELMVRPRIVETVRALERTVASGGLRTDEVSRVLLVGGTSRMPVVAQVIREMFGRPVSMDADPKLAIATGAALFGAQNESTPRSSAPPLATPDVAAVNATASLRHPSAIGRRGRVGAGAAVLAGLAVFAGVKFLRNGDTPPSPGPTTSVASATPSTAPPIAPTASSAVGSVAPTAVLAPSTPGTGVANPASTVVPALVTGGSAERFAFDGTDRGTNIPGLAVHAGAPAELRALAVAPDGSVYVASSDPTVLKVTGGEVSLAARLSAVDVPAAGIVVGSDASVFVATPAGIVRIVDGTRALVLDGPAAGLSTDLGPLAMDGGGNLYIADNGRNRIIRRAPDGTLTLVAGIGVPAAPGPRPADGTAAVVSKIGRIVGLAVDLDGNLLMADSGLRLVREVAPDGTIRTLAGGGTVGTREVVTATRTGSASLPRSARDLAFSSLDGITVDQRQRIYVSDRQGQAIVRFGADRAVELVIDVAAKSTSSANPTNSRNSTDPTSGPAGDGPAAVKELVITSSGTVLFSDGLVVWSVRVPAVTV